MERSAPAEVFGQDSAAAECRRTGRQLILRFFFHLLGIGWEDVVLSEASRHGIQAGVSQLHELRSKGSSGLILQRPFIILFIWP